ncbi:PilC/PilY family type IV pilus protein [Glaciecola siphonariae]|uniref:PilC/PilY family type IV pilus protein n=1 Tax=Glaciecola siphonariae TaxID=521012 RepID=A0ABV9M0E8_9ALTE
MHIKKLTLALSAFSLSFLVNLSAFGDDLEIYLGTNTSQFTFKPNVLFIMDTSGSMNKKDGTPFSRMQRVQAALNKALSEATNINAGLMRFSDFGGPVLFPITDIDQPIPPEIILNTRESGDDAEQPNNSVDINNDILKLTNGSGKTLTGLRFQDLNIPQGATITQAYLRFTSSKIDTDVSDILIRAEDKGNSPIFEQSNKNISNRTLTSSFLLWDQDNNFPVDKEVITTPDFANVVQEVISRSDWCGGNALSLIIEGDSNSSGSARHVYSSDKGESSSPQLVISYDDSSATGCISGEPVYQLDSQADNAEEANNGENNTGNQLNFRTSSNNNIGLRFTNVNIPNGATISKAYVTFTSAANQGTNNSKMTIRGVAEDDVAPFDILEKDHLQNKPKTGASLNWSNIGYQAKDSEFSSPDISNVIQEIVNRSGWTPRSDLALVMSDFHSDGVAAYTVNGSGSGAAKLHIEFSGNATPGNSSTVRDYLISRVNELTTNGYTPIVDTLYEATRYYGGLSVDYGLKRGEPGIEAIVRRSTRVSHRDSYVGSNAVRPFGCSDINLSSNNCVDEYIPTGATYISPVQNLQCQVNNHIVILSDGRANNNHSQGKIATLLGAPCTGSGGEECGVDLASNISKKETSVIDRVIQTHTIGFAADTVANTFLQDLAQAGGGSWYKADNSEQLLEAFTTILSEVKNANTTFVSPGVAVNQLNRLTNKEDLYFALFRPEEGQRWPGNLKKYKIKGNTVLDAASKPAVNTTTGFFDEKSQSIWSTEVDGNDVRKGGAASKLDLVRQLYVFGDAPNSSIALEANKFNETNSSITINDLSISTEPDSATLRENLLKWARGVDVFDEDGDGERTDINFMMGDPIHSQPIIVNYSSTESAVFVATNHGFLHSFDADTGEENFAIMPRELLGNLHKFYENRSSFSHVYGLDGDLVYREANGKKYLYLGMRRGGNNYYAFDVTSKTAPKLVFKIDGGSTGFENLGQTWSRPIITKVKIGGTVKDVIIIGGGYDEDQDNRQSRAPDSIGNSVYMIDADTGAKLWEASDTSGNLQLADMKYSIPARISVIDRNNDGLADHMYVADTGGQLFRLDIYNGNGVGTLVKGKLLASLGGDAAADNRRFYYGPDVAEVVLGDEQYFAVALGSGFRAGPLNTTINDNFYMIKDKGTFIQNSLGEYSFPATTVDLTKLYDATDHLSTTGTSAEQALASQAFVDKDGWYIRLTSGGEKVLSSPLIIDYKILFTTYVPAASSSSLCAPPSGNSRAYLVNLFNANAVTDLNNNNDKDKGDRFSTLEQTGIAPPPTFIFGGGGGEDKSICFGAECADPEPPEDENGNVVPCAGDFQCLMQEIFGGIERVQKDTWKTEVERN